MSHLGASAQTLMQLPSRDGRDCVREQRQRVSAQAGADTASGDCDARRGRPRSAGMVAIATECVAECPRRLRALGP